ncbi:MAG: PAS domain S-box protein [Methanomicrobiaceae archaeon]|nr:PAS domain S-box protein [Methanomicrobiaceae archaeon]
MCGDRTIRVLLISDSPCCTGLIKQHLERSGGIFVTGVSSAEEALHRIKHCDVAVCEYRMPGMDGLTLLSGVRSRHPGLPFIFFADACTKDEVLEALHNGADSFIEKTGDSREEASLLRQAVLRIADRTRFEQTCETEYRAFAEATHEIPYQIDAEGILTYIGPQIGRYGYKPEDIISRPIAEVLCETDRERVLQDFSLTIATGREFPTRFRIVAADGAIRWLEERGVAIVDESGAAFGIRGFLRDITGQKQAEEAARELQRRLSDIIDFLPDATFVIDREGRVIAWNRAMERMTGVPAGEMLGRGDYEYAHPFYRCRRPILIDLAFSQDASIEQHYAWVRKEGSTYMAETTMRRDSGSEMVLWGIATPLYNDEGEIVGAIESIRDITGWRKAEKGLRESEERYRTVFENSGTAMAIVEKDGIVSLVNAESERLFGYAREDTLGKMRFDAFVAPHDRERLWRTFLERNRHPASTPRQYEADIVDAWRKIIRGLFTVACIPGTKSRVVSIIDITDRKRAENRIEHLNRVLLAITNVGERMRMEGDREHLLRGVCATLTETRGYLSAWIALLDCAGRCTAAAEAGLGERHLQLLEYLERGNPAPCIRKALDRSGVVAMQDPVRECADAPFAHMDASWGLMIVRLEHGGKVLGLLAISMPGELVFDREEQMLFEKLAGDIAYALHNLELEDEHHYQEALKRANKKLNLLGSITRHDILNQLTPLFGYADLLETTASENSLTMKYITGIREAARRVQRQISFTRDYEDMGVHAPEWQRVEAVVEQAAKSVPLGRIRLTVTTGALEVFSDPLLEKVFINLLENTVRHGEEATRIHISFIERGDRGIVIVEDDGAGVPVAQKLHIFDRAFGEHTGLGLFLVKEILHITGMSIRETGEAGKGARFEIEIPAGGYRMAPG